MKADARCEVSMVIVYHTRLVSNLIYYFFIYYQICRISYTILFTQIRNLGSHILFSFEFVFSNLTHSDTI